MVFGITTRFNPLKGIRKRIRNRLLVFILPLVYIPLVISGSVILYAFEDSHKSKIRNDIENRSNEISIAIEDLLNSNSTQLSALSKMPSIKESFISYKAAFSQHGAFSSQYQDVEDTYIETVTDVVELGEWHDLFFIDPAGSVVFSILQGRYHAENVFKQGVNDKMRVLFSDTLQTLSPMVLYAGEVRHEENPLVYFSTPLFIDGLLASVIISSVETHVIQKQLLNRNLISSHTGIDIIHYNESSSRGIFSLNSTETWTFESLMAYIKAPKKSEFSHSSLIPSLSSIVILNYDKAHANAPLNTSKLIFLLIFVAISMVIFLASSKLARSFTLPIESLKRSFKKFAEGNEDIVLETTRQDEIGTLIRNFNSMLLKLKATKVKLIESKKLASIGSLSAGVAHEINNPLAIITSNTATLEEYASELSALMNTAEPGQEQCEQAKMISTDINELVQESGTALSRVKNIVASMQIFSEIDSASLEVLHIKHDVKQIVREVAAALGYLPSVKVQCDAELSLTCKVKQFKLALYNIIENAFLAVKDIPEGKIRIVVVSQNGQLELSVTDNGCGIAPELVDRIFDPFFTTRPVGSGIGMGLTVAYTVIQAHQGDISVRSSLSKGTQIQIVLPDSSTKMKQ